MASNEKIMEQVDAARLAATSADYKKASLLYQTAINYIQLTVENADPASREKWVKAMTTLEKEKKQIGREERAFQATIDAVGGCDDSPDAPPADPLVWPDPPPRRAQSVNRKVPGPNPKNKARDTEETKRAVHKSKSQTGLSKNEDKKGRKQSSENDSKEKEDKEKSDGEEKKEFNSAGYDRELVSVIEQTMSRDGVQVSWDDIAGLEETKQLFKQAIILPSLMPQFFTGIRRPWRGVCMVGPPGTGKTLLAKAVATECKTTFFAVNCGDLASKWRGDSEKLVKLLFEMARFYAPSTIFIDEIDAIGSQRGQANEHEASRRVKSQLLVEMDGFDNDDQRRVLVIAATNFPWMLDEALRRRFEKRIYIPLPDHPTRQALLQSALKDISLAPDVRLDSVATMLEGFSGADVTNVCRQAALQGVSRLTRNLSTMEIAAMRPEQLDLPVTMDDFRVALKGTKSSVSQENLDQYKEWIEQYGSS